MKTSHRIVLIAGILCAWPSVAGAQANLRWNQCAGLPGATAAVSYACDGSRNGQPFRLVLSFVSPDSLRAFVGIDADIRIITNSPTLPDFWRLGLGECREGNLFFPASLTGVGTGATGSCRNPWSGANTGGGYLYTSGDQAPSMARLQLAFARDTETQLSPGVQYLAGVMALDTWSDIDSGNGICTGCEIGACLFVDRVGLYQTAGTLPNDIYYVTGGDPVTWRAVYYSDGGGCVTPTRKTSWGSIKATYR